LWRVSSGGGGRNVRSSIITGELYGVACVIFLNKST
jgi:hypothetical protein